MKEKGKYLLIVFVLTLFTSAVTLFMYNIFAALITLTFGILFVVLTRSYWGTNYNKFRLNKVIISSVFGFLIILFAPINAKTVLLLPPILKFCEENGIKSKTILNLLSNKLSNIEMIFILAVLMIVFYFITKDKTVMGVHNLGEWNRLRKNDKKILYFLDMLKKDLDSIDTDTRWSDIYYTPLEADVEIYSNDNRKKRIKKLVKAIKRNKVEDILLVLGEPGSGKSVSLRKLAKELLNEVNRTGRIPVYIDLKYWRVSESIGSIIPDANDLYAFIKEHLKDRFGNIFSTRFINEDFDKLHNEGRFFYILDSFDEIPLVIDTSEHSDVIDSLSSSIDTFFYPKNGTRGILASREFKSPTQKYTARTIYRIRKFDEQRVEKTLKVHIDDKTLKIASLFSSHKKLLRVVKNPFMLGLFANYVVSHNGRLPRNQSELFSSYVDERINECEKLMSKHKLNKSDVIKGAIEISNYILSNNIYGLEVPIEILEKKLGHIRVKKITEILIYSKIARRGFTSDDQFSFVHRRFCEYFAMQKMIRGEIDVSEFYQNTIIEDSKWRDPLVLYCEIDDSSIVNEIVEFCCGMIENINLTKNIRDINLINGLRCLRFLNDAFADREDVIRPFRRRLYEKMTEIVDSEHTILIKKVAIESLHLLDRNQISEILPIAFKLRNMWLNETAFLSCRHISSLSSELQRIIVKYLNDMSLEYSLNNWRGILFSLSLSNGFKIVKRFYTFRLFDMLLMFIGCVLIFSLSPFLFIVMGGMLVSASLVGWIMRKKIKHTPRKLIPIRLYLIFLIATIIIALINDTTSIVVEALEVDNIVRAFIINPLISNISSGDSHEMVICMLLGIGGLLIFPIYDVAYKVLLIKEVNLRKSISNLLIGFLALVLASGVFAGIFYLLSDYIEIISVVFLIIMLAIISYVIVKQRVQENSDRRLVKLCIVEKVISRSDIAMKIGELKTEFGRMMYIEMIQKNCENATNEYPEDFVFLSSHTDSAMLLSKLEEKWLGLSR